ncbi:hypothetical protein BK022_26715 [Methylorubrum extorquens]|uniref:Uncharacterized protein n=1 Tax=Methylorubrum extorquens TaxID=408 RepID=A0A1S1NU14_METEX|nr:hypothetical protein BK022_26715 [Methylorubrum extorquens]
MGLREGAMAQRKGWWWVTSEAWKVTAPVPALVTYYEDVPCLVEAAGQEEAFSAEDCKLVDRLLAPGTAGPSSEEQVQALQAFLKAADDRATAAKAEAEIVEPRLVAFEARAKAAERALVGLTPDGSEFYRRNPDRLSESEFIVDVSACLTQIHDTRERTRQSLVEANRSRAEAVSELRSARFRHEQATRCAGCGERKHTPPQGRRHGRVRLPHLHRHSPP